MITFIDLFSGIGGFRLALEALNCQCVFSAEINKHACKMYEANFGECPYQDVTQIDPDNLPDFDILCAGFPCQAFSIAGKHKGFEDTRGTLFFDICRILEVKKPRAFILENVANLKTHDKGNTFKIMLETLESLGYTVSYNILNAKDFNCPQNRKRMILVGSKKGHLFAFSKIPSHPATSMLPYLDKDTKFEYLNPESYTLLNPQHIKQQTSGLIFCGYLNKQLRNKGVNPKDTQYSRTHRQQNRIYDSKGICQTLASSETSGRYYIKTDQGVRKLTLNECYRFMGFPDSFQKIPPQSECYARIGNSVCVPMIQAVAEQMILQFHLA